MDGALNDEELNEFLVFDKLLSQPFFFFNIYFEYLVSFIPFSFDNAYINRLDASVHHCSLLK